MTSVATPGTLIRVERGDVLGVDTMIWRFMDCHGVSLSSRGGVVDGAYRKPLGGSLAWPSDRRFHSRRQVVSHLHSLLLLSR